MYHVLSLTRSPCTTFDALWLNQCSICSVSTEMTKKYIAFVTGRDHSLQLNSFQHEAVQDILFYQRLINVYSENESI